MKNNNNILVLEKKDCTNCQLGKIAKKIPCPYCKGTGNGKRGAKGKCKNCYGYKTKYDWNDPVTCNICSGNYQNFADETETDYYDENIWNQLEFKIIRQERKMTTNESLVGIGSIYCCVDYGRTWQDDSKVMAEVLKHNKDQVCKIVKNGKFCDYVAIIVTTQGYIVKAIWNN